MPRTFQGLGPDSLVPKVIPSALSALKLGAEEGFVLSRVDGRVTIAQICLLVPFDADVTATILGELARVGAIEIPGGEVAEPLPKLTPAVPGTPVASTKLDGLDLTVDQARRIDEFFSTLGTRDAFELLEVTPEADKKEIKRAYFKLSKEFHPDRFFNKSLGPYADRLSKIFQSIKAAFELLNDDARRAAYLDSVQR
ncbi:MAG: heat shock protein DnaJ domain protein [Myxococcales bacterium]|nr:heat shock protein DnaJ domain protein [Myxococcales bacterium]